ncbi:MAG: hypothetical protein EXS17_07140 [Phycisphaerales bacterium]|nr:hypothetical protein [Phycisphaerales bacterium]
MKTTTSHIPVALCLVSLAIAGAVAFGFIGATALTSNANPTLSTPLILAGTPDFEYARLVVTVAPQSTMVWINTPLGAATANVGKGVDGTLEPIQTAIRATTADSGFSELAPGLPMDDMMLVQWMGLANWELAAVTQNQVDQGSTTSFFFKRLK